MTRPNDPNHRFQEGLPVTVALNVPDASPKRLLVEWANSQDGWVREAVARVVSSSRALSATQLDSLVELFLVEKAFDPERQPQDVPLLELPEGDSTTEDVLELKTLAGVVGVNALAENQTLEFDPCLTVLFGQNGTGKTGYSRVLKRLAAVRTAEDILPNAHVAGAAKTPSAALAYQLNGVADVLNWQNEAGVAPFTRMSVFDAPAVALHVDDELNYVFTPREIALFGHVTTAIRHVQERVESQVRELRATGNPFLASFQRGTSIYPKIETLGPTTDLAELEALQDNTEDSAARQEALAGDVAALKSGSVDARYDAVKQELSRVEALRSMAAVIVQFDAGVYEANRLALARLQEAYRRARTDLFESDDLPGPADDEWTSFAAAADHYRAHLGLDEYPSKGDTCLYCGQTLSEQSLALVGKYRTYLDDALAGQVEAAQQALNESKLSLEGLSADVLAEHVRQIAASEPAPDYSQGVSQLLPKVVALKAASDMGEPLKGVVDVVDLGKQTHIALEAAHAKLTAFFEDLAKQKQDRTQTLSSKERQLAELTAKRTIARHLPAIVTFVQNGKRAARMDTLARAMSSGLQRSLTVLSKQASEDLVNRNFQKLFDEECLALRAPAVALAFQGRRGQAERKKVVATYRPSSVLSEGEQKVLAIADFLAECRMTGVKAPIIFDDPVTSLDYLRLNEVAERISRLAETHQVVVFTHNIFFASTLLALRNNKRLKCKFYEVTCTDTEKGVLRADVEPRQDTAADIGKRINQTIERAKSADSVMQEALIERGYGLLRSWCEAFVEQEVLANVTQRYRMNVMMGGLQKIKLDRIEKTIAVVIPLFDKCSRFMPGHSQPVEQLNIRPSLEDFTKDWDMADAARKEHIA